MKQRGDVIFHLGTVIILVLSGSLPWLVGRLEFCGECLCSLLHTPAFSLPFAATLSHPDNNRCGGCSPLMGAGLQGSLLTGVLKKGTNFSGNGGISFRPNEDRAFIIEMQLVFPFSKHLGRNDSLCLALSLAEVCLLVCHRRTLHILLVRSISPPSKSHLRQLCRKVSVT